MPQSGDYQLPSNGLSSVQESVRLAREQSQRHREEMEARRKEQEEETRRQLEEQKRRNEQLLRQTSAGQAQQSGLGGGMDPSSGLGIASKFMNFGGGEAAGAAAGGGGSGAAAGGSAAGGGSGAAAGGSALGSAGPWAALAAVIAGNELEARDKGRRDDRKATHLMDLITGKVLEQDMDYYGDKVGGFGGEILKGVGKLGNPEGVFNVVKGIFD